MNQFDMYILTKDGERYVISPEKMSSMVHELYGEVTSTPLEATMILARDGWSIEGKHFPYNAPGYQKEQQ